MPPDELAERMSETTRIPSSWLKLIAQAIAVLLSLASTAAVINYKIEQIGAGVQRLETKVESVQEDLNSLRISVVRLEVADAVKERESLRSPRQ